MKNKTIDIILVVIALLFLVSAVFSLLSYETLSIPALPFIMFGCACGLFGHSLGNMFARKKQKEQPEEVKKMEIALNDERNIALTHRAKAKAFDMMIYIFGLVLLALALIGITPIIGLVLVFAAYIAVITIYGIYLNKFHKEM